VSRSKGNERPLDRWLFLVALIGGIAWIAIGVITPTGGNRESENFWSRLWAPALAFIAAGFLGLFRSTAYAQSRTIRSALGVAVVGILAMALANVAELAFR
jgi:hypothetical protein